MRLFSLIKKIFTFLILANAFSHFFSLSFASTIPLKKEDIITKIAFGSCNNQNKKQTMWETIKKDHPKLFIFLGDNVYADTENMETMRSRYNDLWTNSSFESFRKQVPILATWDDHDYGANDAGMEYPQKEESKNIFLDFFDPINEKRRYQNGGIYTSYLLGPEGKRTHIILLDSRWSRSQLKKHNFFSSLFRQVKGMGPYRPSNKLGSSILGKDQWNWLEKEFNKKADLRIVGTSIQALAEFTGWESWANIPHERSKLLALIKKFSKTPTFLISGDVHRGEMAQVKLENGLSVLEVTSSGLTHATRRVPPNKHRLYKPILKPHFALIEIDWGNQIIFSFKGKNGQVFRKHKVRF
tara:strand:- start:1919 stop:2983 length:1065 start_codon:yes stop_codon:yes gene_type:complete